MDAIEEMMAVATASMALAEANSIVIEDKQLLAEFDAVKRIQQQMEEDEGHALQELLEGLQGSEIEKHQQVVAMEEGGEEGVTAKMHRMAEEKLGELLAEEEEEERRRQRQQASDALC